MYEVLVKIKGKGPPRFERILVRATNARKAEEWALDDLVRASGDRVEVVFVQPERAAERWNKAAGFTQLSVTQMGALHRLMSDLSEQEAKVLWGMLHMRLQAGNAA